MLSLFFFDNLFDYCVRCLLWYQRILHFYHGSLGNLDVQQVRQAQKAPVLVCSRESTNTCWKLHFKLYHMSVEDQKTLPLTTRSQPPPKFFSHLLHLRAQVLQTSKSLHNQMSTKYSHPIASTCATISMSIQQ